MRKYAMFSLVVMAFVAWGMSPVSAQNEDEDINYSYGTVVSQSPNQIVVLEYDYDRDEEVQVTYEVGADTKIENVESLDKLQNEDNIEVYYKDAGGKKIAVSIEKELTTDDSTVILPDEMTEDVLPEEPAEDINVDGVVAPEPVSEQPAATPPPAEPGTAQ